MKSKRPNIVVVTLLAIACGGLEPPVETTEDSVRRTAVAGGGRGPIVPLAVAEFDAYIAQNLCRYPDPATPKATLRAAGDEGCLEILRVNVCRSGCWRFGYNYRQYVDKAGQLDLHMSVPYLRKLRNVVSKELLHGQRVAGTHTFGMSLADLLYHQVQMSLRDPRIAYRASYNGSSWASVDVSQVLTRKAVDPSKFDGVVYTNGAGKSHSMTQADMVRWLASVGEMLASRGRGASGTYYLQLAERFFMAFEVPDRFGGVRNNKAGYRCHANKYCYFFHGQEVEDYPMASSVLNKTVYAIRDLMETAVVLKRWRDYGSCNCPDGTCARRFREQTDVGGAVHTCTTPGDAYPVGAVASNLADQMLERARGGLFNLAYGWGNAGHPGVWYQVPPPNLAEFMKPTSGGGSRQYYRSWYYYWASTPPSPYNGAPTNFARGPGDISPENNCRYHYLTLQLFQRIFEMSEESAYLASNTDFTDVRYSLLYGRAPGTHTSCQSGGTAMAGVPLAEFYLSGRTSGFDYQVSHGRCTEFMIPFVWGSTPVRAWYDEHYAGCSY